MQVNPENGPPEIYVTWSDPRMTDFENASELGLHWTNMTWSTYMCTCMYRYASGLVVTFPIQYLKCAQGHISWSNLIN